MNRIIELENEIIGLTRQLAESQAQVEALRRDGERLDWLEKTPVAITVPMHTEPKFHIFSDSGDGEGDTLRAAIDSAQRQEAK